jgi:hypothetical protein
MIFSELGYEIRSQILWLTAPGSGEMPCWKLEFPTLRFTLSKLETVPLKNGFTIPHMKNELHWKNEPLEE